MNLPLRIAFVGAGNVASRLAPCIAADPRFDIILCASRNLEHAHQLAGDISSRVAFTDDFNQVRLIEPDIVLVSVADDALEEVVHAVGRLKNNPLILHTSGTMSRSMLQLASPRTGILYPLQTFTKGRAAAMNVVPIFTEAEFEDDWKIVDMLASSISQTVLHTDPEKRKGLHIAGVMTNNFTNILLEQVEKILKQNGYGIEVVRPLLEETVAKAFALGPHAAQTGPARRGDRTVIEQHIRLLPDNLKNIYASLSELIIKSHHE